MALHMPRLPGFAFLLSLVAAAPAAAFDQPVVASRLVVAGGIEDGAYRAALEIDLPDGWHTYWRNPGDAGIPPIFDVAKSANLGDFSIGYPVPARHVDGAGTSLIYEGRLMLPIRAVPARPGEPVTLAVRVLYGLCEQVCVPAEADVSARLEPAAAADPEAAAAIAAAAASVPARHDDGRFAVDAVRFDRKTGRGRVEVSLPDDGRLVDLFAAGPVRWYAAPPEPAGEDNGRRRFVVALEGPSGTNGTDGVELSFVLAERTGAFEVVRRLDAATE
jgi:DsbC/DsbD-like thiol-disulfide interchange protein